MARRWRAEPPIRPRPRTMIAQVEGSGTPPRTPEPPLTGPGMRKAFETPPGPGASRLGDRPPTGPESPKSTEPPPPRPWPWKPCAAPSKSSNKRGGLGAMSDPDPPEVPIEPDSARPAKTAVDKPACHPETPPAPGAAASEGDPWEPDPNEPEAEPSNAEPDSLESELESKPEPPFLSPPEPKFEPPAPESTYTPMSLSRSIRSASAGALPMPRTEGLRPCPPPAPSGADSVTSRTFPRLA